MSEPFTRTERRVVSAAYRALTSTNDAQYRALNRVESLAGPVAALEIWLRTKPDPKVVEELLKYRLLSASPLRNMASVQKPVSWADVVKERED